MSCDVAKFTISKNFPNRFDFTIKANGSTLPMEIEELSDTFTAYLIKLDDNKVVLTKTLLVTDALSGKVTLLITSEETQGLVSERGSKVDRYYLRPTYKLVIDCATVNNGIFTAKVPEVYVD